MILIIHKGNKILSGLIINIKDLTTKSLLIEHQKIKAKDLCFY